MSELNELSLKYFYIYNDCFGQMEGEEEQKIMYYFPPKVNLDEKMKNVGLSEAIIQFTETFSNKQPCESLHTLKSRHYYFKPEPHFIIVMAVNVPMRNSVEGPSYHGEEVHNSICLAVVKQAYLMYRLFHNTFTSQLEASEGNPSALKQKLDLFFNKYLNLVKLHNCDVLDVFQGVQFLPLDKHTFLHVQSFINLLEAKFAVVDFSAFLYKDSLIWSGLEPADMQVVFNYLVYSLMPKYSDMNKLLSSAHHNSYGRFVTGPENVHSNSNSVGNVPKIFLSHVKPTAGTYHIVVYKSSSCSICLFIPESEQLTMEMFRKWDTFLGPRLTKLDLEVAAYASRQTSSSTNAVLDGVSRFVYFNRMNLATKSTIHPDGRWSGSTSTTPQVLRILADINADHTRNSGVPSAETIVKTTSDYWVVGKLSNSREFYIVIQHKNANLIEINDEVDRICNNELKSIFFHV